MVRRPSKDMAIPRRGRLGFPPALLLFLVASIAFGAAAAFLAAPIVPFHSGGASSGPFISAELLGILLLGVIASVAVFLLIYRLTQPSAVVPARVVAVYLVALLLLTGFAILFKELDTGSATPTTHPTPGGNQTGPANGTGKGNSSGNGTTAATSMPIPLPPWAFLLIPIVVVILLLALVVPFLLARRELWGGSLEVPSTRDAFRRTLHSALEELESASASDARALIIACYARLLEHVERMAGTLEAQTPSEIYRDHLVRLGVRHGTAERLTRLFEEARYSSHPFGVEEGNEARRVFHEALTDLDRRPVAS
jgi:hypothetical protein